MSMIESGEVHFSQARVFGSETFVLRHDRVIVRESQAGVPVERQIRLVDIAPEIEFTDRRFRRFLVPSLIFAAIFGAAAWKVSRPWSKGDWMSLALEVLFGSFALSALFAGVVLCDPIEVARVRNRSGEVLFQLFRDRSVAVPYGEFLLQLQRRISSVHA